LTLAPGTRRIIGGIVRIVLALAMVGGLAFLYFMSQTGELRRHGQVGTYLRGLREVDARWNAELAGARNEAVMAEPRPREGGQRLQPLLQDLESETASLDDATLSAGFHNLRQAFMQKEALVDQFARQSAAVRATLRGLLMQMATVRQSAAAVADPALRARLAPLDIQLKSLSSELLRLHVQPDEELGAAVQTSVAALDAQTQGLPETLRTPLASLPESVSLIFAHERELAQLAQKIDLLPTAQRVISISDAYDRAFQAIADEKERYRVYLAFYSAALLVFLAYVLWQLGRSYVKINNANEALRSANETLEQRVAERTQELSQALKHLKESELLLVQTEKMSSLGQMVAGIAHEINTPLAYVKSSLATLQERLPVVHGAVRECQHLLGMLERGDASDEELSAQFAKVSDFTARLHAEAVASELEVVGADALHGIEQISEIILNLKNFSRLDRSRVSRFNLNEGLESTLVIARNVVKHKTVHKRFAEIPLIECSPSQINQVFLNLITNAAQATDDVKGEITVSTGVATGSQVRVDVSDNGHGIPESVIPKIFDPFFTTKDVGAGTGLGLSIAYKIVQEHRGRIEVKSQVGQGTTFTVFLPIKAVQPQPLAA
jgi:signal transduction histidine kinase